MSRPIRAEVDGSGGQAEVWKDANVEDIFVGAVEEDG